MPYLLDKIGKDKGKGSKWIILNRNYKPLGIEKGFVDYEDFFFYANIRINTLRNISYKELNENPSRVYLYNDGCIPTISKKNMKDYLKRLDHLMSIRAKKYNFPESVFK